MRAVRASTEEKGPGIHCLRMRQFSEIFSEIGYSPGYFRYFNRYGRRGKWDVSVMRGAMSAADASDDFADALSYSLNQLGLPHVSLKEEQRLAVKEIYEGRDVFVWLPTGYGKSLCYQTIPFMMDYKLGLKESSRRSGVLVVSPLVALMIDQVQNLRKRGLKSSIITSTSSVAKEFLAGEMNFLNDSLLFCAREALVTPRWRAVLEDPTYTQRIVSVVIDEAHCISKW